MKMITKKDIGKRVSATGYKSGVPFTGTGKIVHMEHGIMGVQFDKELDFGHNCDGKAKDGYGWYVTTKDAELIPCPGIRLETEKVVECNGDLSRKITKVKMLKSAKLPGKYLQGKRPIVYLGWDGENIFCSNSESAMSRYMIGETLTEKEFQVLLTHCHKAGDHLMDVNRELAAKKAEWNGVETFII
jgi:hypothetical protein